MRQRTIRAKGMRNVRVKYMVDDGISVAVSDAYGNLPIPNKDGHAFLTPGDARELAYALNALADAADGK